MIHIAICSQNAYDCSYIENLFYNFWGRDNIFVEEFFSYPEFIRHDNKQFHFEIILLELFPEDLKNTRIKEHLSSQNHSLIIYIISREFHAKELSDILETHPFSSITKPFSETRILETMKLAYQQLFSQNNFFYAKTKKCTYCIPLDDILYFEKDKRRLRIVTDDFVHCYYADINNVYAYLCTISKNFVRIHYSYIVNVKYITRFNKKQIQIRERCFSISKKYGTDLFRFFEY